MRCIITNICASLSRRERLRLQARFASANGTQEGKPHGGLLNLQIYGLIHDKVFKIINLRADY